MKPEKKHFHQHEVNQLAKSGNLLETHFRCQNVSYIQDVALRM